MTSVVDWLDVLPPACDVLRPYQRDQLAQIAGVLHAGVRRILIQLPTGGGKTHEIAGLVLAAHQAGLRVLVLATRTRLIRQLDERLAAFGVPHGVIAAELPHLRWISATVQIASADTLYRRALVDERMPLPAADVIVFDEAHLSVATSRLRVLQSYPNAQLFGFTATPARRSGRPLRDSFDHLIVGPTVPALVNEKVLVRARIFNKPVIEKNELRGVERGIDGDYQAKQLSDIMTRVQLVGDVVSNWLRIANGKRTVVFAVDKRHGAALVQEFMRAGVAAEMLTDADDDDSREAVLARLESGETKVVANCFLLSYGVDLPSIEAIVLARPTRSVVMYLQSIGRGMRPAPGKESVIVIDHGRVVDNLGLPTDDFSWSLDDININRKAEEAHTERAAAKDGTRTCDECGCLWVIAEQGNSCPECGWCPTPAPRALPTISADLNELDADGADRAADVDVYRFFAEACTWYARRWPDRWKNNHKTGRWWAWTQTRARFKIGDDTQIPRSFWTMAGAPTSPETAGWLQHRLIRWARSMASKTRSSVA